MFEEILVFTISQSSNGLGLRTVVGCAMWQLDFSRHEEGGHAIVTGLAIDVASVVGVEVKGNERFARLCRPLLQKPIEQLFPGHGMDAGRFRQDPIQIE
jgi:hypothetical protein